MDVNPFLVTMLGYSYEEEERFRGIFEKSAVGKALTAPDGRLVKVNQSFADLLGYSIEEHMVMGTLRANGVVADTVVCRNW